MLSIVASVLLSSSPLAVVGGAPVHPERLLVKAPLSTASRAAAGLGARVVSAHPEIGWTIVEAPTGRLQATRAALAAVPGIVRVDFDRRARLAYTPNDPFWSQQWHMRAIKADAAWDTSRGSDAAIVAVIDTGVRLDHEDLAANVWRNPGEVAGNGLDDDGNGFVDDLHGWNFVALNNDLTDAYGHGTPCAGLVAAVQDNGIGVTGVAPRARVMAIKATNPDGYLFDSYLVPSYVYAANMGARVFSMSYFSDRVSAAERDALDYAVGRGVLPIAAAANEDSAIPMYPAAYDIVMSVGAVDGGNFKSWFSNFGTWVDVAAPGEGLLSTGADGGYTGFGGTSGACPHVAGVAALLIGAKPTASAGEVRAAIEDTARPLVQAPYGEWTTYGLVDAEAALNALLTGPAPHRPVAVRSMTVVGTQIGAASIDPSPLVTTRIRGRGFLGVGDLRIQKGNETLTIQARARDWVDVLFRPRAQGDFTLWDGGTLLATVPSPVLPRTANPLIDASGVGAAASGGFFDALTDDGREVTLGRDSNGQITLQTTFWGVRPNAFTQVRLNRRFTAAGGTQRLEFYDWSSGSYPYGSWVQVWSGPVNATPEVLTLNVPEIGLYRDPSGTVYARIVATGTPNGARLAVDSLRLQLSR